MRAHPGQPHGLRARDRRGEAQRLVGGSSDPTHAGVDLQMDGVIAAAGNGDCFELGVGIHREVELGTHGLDQLRCRLLAEHKDRAIEPGGAQRPDLPAPSATHSPVAPPRSAAPATGTAPWP